VQRLAPQWPEPVVRRARIAYARALADPLHIGDGLERTIELTNAALHFDPPPAAALAIRGEVLSRMAWLGLRQNTDATVKEAEENLRAAVRLRADQARAWSALGEALFYQGRFDEAIESYRTAMDADAFLAEMPNVLGLLALTAVYTGRFDTARESCDAGQRRYPGDSRFAHCDLMLLCTTSRARGDVARAWRMVDGIEVADSTESLASQWSHRRMWVAILLARSGLRDSARAVLARTERERGIRPRAGAFEAYARTLLGERDEAVRVLAAELAARPQARALIARNPWYAPLRDHPQFRALVAAPPAQ
jgi:Flp pilus assembly protein TadD